MKRVVVIGGDGIGPEVIGEATRVLASTGVPLRLDPRPAGASAFRETGAWLPRETLAAARGADAVLFGANETPLSDPGHRSPILELRRELDVFANVRPARDWGQGAAAGLDLVIVRENTEGMYAGREEEDTEGVTTFRRVTRRACERLVDFAVRHARADGRRRLTCVHKANVLRRSDELFRRAFHERAGASGLVLDECLVDAAAMFLVRDPGRFDVVVTLNLYGDVLSDEAAGLAGGLGFAPSGSYGDRHAVFEPVHGTAPDIAGKGVANPVAAILSGALMLAHLGFGPEAKEVEAAVRSALGKGRTRDAGGALGSREFADLVVAGIKPRRR